MSDIALLCQELSYELGILDSDQSCTTTANIAYLGKCQGPIGGCSDPDPGETGFDSGFDSGLETGTEDSETGDPAPGYWDLDLQAEVSYVDGEFHISQHLIDTVLTDPVGVSQDGTFPTQLVDGAGTPYAFEIRGATPQNLGGVLGFEDGDLILAVDGLPTASYADLLEVAALLLGSETVAVELERGGSPLVLRYRRAR